MILQSFLIQNLEELFCCLINSILFNKLFSQSFIIFFCFVHMFPFLSLSGICGATSLGHFVFFAKIGIFMSLLKAAGSLLKGFIIFFLTTFSFRCFECEVGRAQTERASYDSNEITGSSILRRQVFLSNLGNGTANTVQRKVFSFNAVPYRL